MSEPFEQSNLTEAVEKNKDKRALEHVRRFMKRSDEYRKPHLELARQSRELYECWHAESKSVIQRANIKLPYGYTIIETQMPMIAEGILRERPIISVEGVKMEDMSWENTLSDYMDTQIDDMKFPMKLLSYLKGMKLDGTGFCKVPYKYKEQLIKQKSQGQDPLTGLPYPIVQQVPITVFDGPDFEVIPFVDAFPDWQMRIAGDVENMRGFCHRTWRTFAEIKSNRKRKLKDGGTIGVYENLDELKTSMSIKGTGEGVAWKAPYYTDNYSAAYDRSQDNRNGRKEQDKIEIWEFWGIFDETGEGDFVEYIITIANGDVLLRCEENFYDYKIKPFCASPNVPRDGEFYGIPELLAVRGLIKESNVLRNAALDQVNIGINKMYIVDRNAGIKARQLYSRPSGIIWANDINGLRELAQPELPAAAYRSLQDIQTDMQTAIGLGNAPGAPSTFNNSLARSATGAQYLQSFSASRAGLSLRIIADTLLKPMYRIMLKTNEQFVSDDVFVRNTDPNQQNPGNPFSVLPKEAWQSSFAFKLRSKIDTGGNDTNFQKHQQLQQYLQIAESTQPGSVNWEIFFEDVARDLVGNHFKKFIRSQQERMQIQQQQLAMEQAAQVQAGQRAPQPNAGAVGMQRPALAPAGGPVGR